MSLPLLHLASPLVFSPVSFAFSVRQDRGGSQAARHAVCPRPHCLWHRSHLSCAKALLCQHHIWSVGLTALHCTAGEAVVAELAPELVPMLSALEMPANFVPVTNAVLSEMQRRGVARDQLLTALRRMGEDMPCATVAMLQVGAPQTLHLASPVSEAHAIPVALAALSEWSDRTPRTLSK